MATKHAMRRYVRVLIPSMVLYLVSLLGVTTLKATAQIPDWGIAALSIIPGLAIIWLMTGHYRFMHECDEMQRKIHVDSMLIAIFITLGISTTIGLVEMVLDKYWVGIFWVFPALYGLYGMISGYKSRQVGLKCLP